MARSKKGIDRQKSVIMLVVILSLVLYFGGVISGLFANKVIKEETKDTINSFKGETREGLYDLKKYVDILETNLATLQLEKTFIDTLSLEDKCNFSKIALEDNYKTLQAYWKALPFRIEEYERDHEKTEEYKSLKQRYTELSLQTWLMEKTTEKECDDNVLVGLYFYSSKCEKCVDQGIELDKFKDYVRKKNVDPVIFTLDYDFEKSFTKHLISFYGLNSTPSLLIANQKFVGFTKSEELISWYENEKTK